MPSPFPGMDPWLEDPAIWPGVHLLLIANAHDHLQPQLHGRFYVQPGERVVIEEPLRSIYPDLSVVERARPRPYAPVAAAAVLAPDPPTVLRISATAERREGFLEIRDAQAGHKVVTVIEVLSPSNKRPGPGRDLYVGKQAEVLASDASLVEVDLLRDGQPTAALPAANHGASLYRVVTSRPQDRLVREVHFFGLRERLPCVAVPVTPEHGDIVLALPAVFGLVYEKGVYGSRIDYARDPVPPLASDDAAWARELLAGRTPPR